MEGFWHAAVRVTGRGGRLRDIGSVLFVFCLASVAVAGC